LSHDWNLASGEIPQVGYFLLTLNLILNIVLLRKPKSQLAMGTKDKSIIAVVIILAVLPYWHQRNQGESVQSFQQKVIGEVNQGLLSPDNPIRKRI